MDKQERDRIDLEQIELFFIWNKASRVIASCRTEEQIEVAKRYVSLASQRQAEFQNKRIWGVSKKK